MFDTVMVGQMLRAGDGERELDTAALAAARSKTGNAAQKLQTYVRCHRDSAAHFAAWTQFKSRIRLALICVCVAAALFGACAAILAFSKSLEASSAVNMFWLLGSLLGVNTISLVLWGLIFWRSPQTSLSFPSLLMLFHRLASSKASGGPLVLRAYRETHLSGWRGRCRLSAISHGIWLIYLMFGLFASFLLLSIQSFSFVWETTLLNPETAIALIQGIGEPINEIGWPVPDEQAIRAAQSVGGTAGETGAAATWAKFCLAAITLYGVVPRALLWMASLIVLRRAPSTASLPISDPYYAGILAQIYQPIIQNTVIDADDVGRATIQDVKPQISAKTYKPNPDVIVIGWEVDTQAQDHLTAGQVGGFFETPEALAEAVEHAEGRPVRLIVSALNTPDRGVAMALEPFRALSPAQKSAWIVDGAALQSRSSAADVQRRLGDWWAVLTKLGFEHTAIESDEGAVS